jgi:hypothetical protein
MRLAVVLGLSIAISGSSVSAQMTEERCLSFSGTSDAVRKSNAVEAALKSLRKAIDKWKAETATVGPFTETAERPQPVPYWRSSIRPELFLQPDVVTDTVHTICWRGVFSPVVCTSGTRLCWPVTSPAPLPETRR